jgi:hypothetical protein
LLWRRGNHWTCLYCCWWLFLRVFIFVKEKIHQLNLVDIVFIFRSEYLFWCTRVNIELLGILFLFLFLELVLDNAEKIFKVVSFLKRCLTLINGHKIFIEILMCKFHHVALFCIIHFYLCLFFLTKAKIFKYFIFIFFWFSKSWCICCCSFWRLWFFDDFTWIFNTRSLKFHRLTFIWFWFFHFHFFLLFCLFFDLKLIQLNNIFIINLSLFQIFEKIRIFNNFFISKRYF